MSKTISAEDFGPKYSSPIPAEWIARLAKPIINALEADELRESPAPSTLCT